MSHADMQTAIYEGLGGIADEAQRRAATHDVVKALAVHGYGSLSRSQPHEPHDGICEGCYANGESSGYADWSFAMDEIIPDTVNSWSPHDVAEWVEGQLEKVETGEAADRRNR